MNSFAKLRVALIAALCGALIGAAKAQVSPQLAQKAPEADAISAEAAQNGHVRIIVEFAGPVPADQLRPDPQVLGPVRAEIATRQNAIIASHFGSATNPSEGQGFPRGLVRFQITPTFAVNVSPSELDAMAADSAVLRIYYDHRGSALLPQSVPLIGMIPAYAANATGARQAVAVLDTGVQTNHEFLSGNVLDLQACFSNGDNTGASLCPNRTQMQIGNGAADTSIPACVIGSTNRCSHGTHVAGIAAGNNTNPESSEPANGVAKNAKIMPVQVFTRVGNKVSFRTTDIMRALEWMYTDALPRASGFRFAAVNLSLGTDRRYSSVCDEQFGPLTQDILLLRNAGVVTVAATGNDGERNEIDSPACISAAVAVGSTDKNDRLSIFSNMIPEVSLVAPGGLGPLGTLCKPGADNPNILSSISGVTAAVNYLYDCYWGTSMATPHVAGAFAAIRTVCPDATIDRISAALQTTGKSVPYFAIPEWRTVRRINVDLARQALGCARHDFNGNSKSDIVWRDAAGDISMWLMNGAQVLLSERGIGELAHPTWSLVGQRDFDGDGKSDLLWRDTTGNTSIWFMNGSTHMASAGGLEGTISPNLVDPRHRGLRRQRQGRHPVARHPRGRRLGLAHEWSADCNERRIGGPESLSPGSWRASAISMATARATFSGAIPQAIPWDLAHERHADPGVDGQHRPCADRLVSVSGTADFDGDGGKADSVARHQRRYLDLVHERDPRGVPRS